MTSRSKTLLALAAAAALLSGCATGPYYDGYAYDDGYYYRDGYYYERPAYNYYPAPAYYPRYQVAPSIGFGFSYGRHRH